MANQGFLLTFSVAIIVLITVNSCNQDRGHLFPEGDHIPGLVGTLYLQSDETQIRLDNIFRLSALPLIDSVVAHPSLRVRLSSDNSVLSLNKRSVNIPVLSGLTIWTDGVPYGFLVRRSEKEAHTFSFDPEGKRIRNVMIKGDMTNWEPIPMALVDGIWQINLLLTPGYYKYFLVINGKELSDPVNEMIMIDDDGKEYSAIEIGSGDPYDTPRVVAKDTRGSIIELELENQPAEIFVFWQNFRLPPDNIDRDGRRLMVKIPRDARKQELSFLRVMIAGRNTIGNEVLIPLHRGSAKF